MPHNRKDRKNNNSVTYTFDILFYTQEIKGMWGGGNPNNHEQCKRYLLEQGRTEVLHEQ